MLRILVVANQTLGGERLTKEIQDRLNLEPCHFHVLVPQTEPTDLAPAWIPDDPAMGAEMRARAQSQAFEDAYRQSQARLDRVVADIRDAGGDADGELGDADPLKAVEAVQDLHSFDEVIVSTLPTRLSRWLGMDLPSRLQRRLDIPVTTVVWED